MPRLESFDLDGRTFTVLKVGRLRIGWWKQSQIGAILAGREALRIWSTRPRRTA